MLENYYVEQDVAIAMAAEFPEFTTGLIQEAEFVLAKHGVIICSNYCYAFSEWDMLISANVLPLKEWVRVLDTDYFSARKEAVSAGLEMYKKITNKG